MDVLLFLKVSKELTVRTVQNYAYAEVQTEEIFIVHTK
jgi:hypothetical protein